MQRQADRRGVIGIGADKMGHTVARRVIGLAVHGNVVDLRADALAAESPHQSTARDAKFRKIDPYGIDVPSGGGTRIALERFDSGFEWSEPLVIGCDEFPAMGHKTVELGELR